jgi:hypothetical protein
MTQTTASPWCELCTERIQEGCFGCDVVTGDYATVTDAAIVELHRIADTPSRAGAMLAAAAALGSATDGERWPLMAVFVDALRTYGLSVVDFIELLECAAGEVAAD